MDRMEIIIIWLPFTSWWRIARQPYKRDVVTVARNALQRSEILPFTEERADDFMICMRSNAKDTCVLLLSHEFRIYILKLA